MACRFDLKSTYLYKPCQWKKRPLFLLQDQRTTTTFFSIYLVVTWLFGGNLDTITGRKKVHLFVFRPNIHQRKIRSRQFLSLFSMFLLTTMGTKLLQRLRSFLSEDLIISRVMNHVTCYKFQCSYCIGWDYL